MDIDLRDGSTTVVVIIMVVIDTQLTTLKVSQGHNVLHRRIVGIHVRRALKIGRNGQGRIGSVVRFCDNNDGMQEGSTQVPQFGRCGIAFVQCIIILSQCQVSSRLYTLALLDWRWPQGVTVRHAAQIVEQGLCYSRIEGYTVSAIMYALRQGGRQGVCQSGMVQDAILFGMTC